MAQLPVLRSHIMVTCSNRLAETTAIEGPARFSEFKEYSSTLSGLD